MRNCHTGDASLFKRARNEAGSFHILDELAQIIHSLAAAFDDSHRLANRHETIFEHTRTGKPRRMRNKSLPHTREHVHFAGKNQIERLLRALRPHDLSML